MYLLRGHPALRRGQHVKSSGSSCYIWVPDVAVHTTSDAGWGHRRHSCKPCGPPCRQQRNKFKEQTAVCDPVKVFLAYGAGVPVFGAHLNMCSVLELHSSSKAFERKHCKQQPNAFRIEISCYSVHYLSFTPGRACELGGFHCAVRSSACSAQVLRGRREGRSIPRAVLERSKDRQISTLQ